jgi:hypothetical protein
VSEPQIHLQTCMDDVGSARQWLRNDLVDRKSRVDCRRYKLIVSLFSYEETNEKSFEPVFSGERNIGDHCL